MEGGREEGRGCIFFWPSVKREAEGQLSVCFGQEDRARMEERWVAIECFLAKWKEGGLRRGKLDHLEQFLADDCGTPILSSTHLWCMISFFNILTCCMLPLWTLTDWLHFDSNLV